jgi:hypothetical protein
LLPSDANKLIAEVHAELKELLEMMQTGPKPELSLKELREIQLYS